MGTRGFIGFVADGRETIVYNHYDSYPSVLGLECLGFATHVNMRLASDPWEDVKNDVRALVHVDNAVPPTLEQITEVAQWTDLNVSTSSVTDWYCLLRGTQGNPREILAAKYVDHHPAFPLDSLWCEWGYLFDLDSRVFEVYGGFRQNKHLEGRFARRSPDWTPSKTGSYYAPVALLASYHLTNLPHSTTLLNLEADHG